MGRCTPCWGAVRCPGRCQMAGQRGSPRTCKASVLQRLIPQALTINDCLQGGRRCKHVLRHQRPEYRSLATSHPPVAGFLAFCSPFIHCHTKKKKKGKKNRKCLRGNVNELFSVRSGGTPMGRTRFPGQCRVTHARVPGSGASAPERPVGPGSC